MIAIMKLMLLSLLSLLLLSLVVVVVVVVVWPHGAGRRPKDYGGSSAPRRPWPAGGLQGERAANSRLSDGVRTNGVVAEVRVFFNMVRFPWLSSMLRHFLWFPCTWPAGGLEGGTAAIYLLLCYWLINCLCMLWLIDVYLRGTTLSAGGSPRDDRELPGCPECLVVGFWVSAKRKQKNVAESNVHRISQMGPISCWNRTAWPNHTAWPPRPPRPPRPPGRPGVGVLVVSKSCYE